MTSPNRATNCCPVIDRFGRHHPFPSNPTRTSTWPIFANWQAAHDPLRTRKYGMCVMSHALIVLMAAFAAAIPAASWMIGHLGDCSGPVCTIPVGFGLHAPSGVLMIGLMLVLRDAIHERGGFLAVAGAVAIGAIATLAVASPALALASLAAFVAAEAIDTATYTALRSRGRAAAVLASGLVGAAADSAVFLLLAFGSLDYLAGQTLGKIYASVAVALWLTRHRYA